MVRRYTYIYIYIYIYIYEIILFLFREEVIVYKSVDMKVKLAKAIYLGPHNDTDKAGNAVAVDLFTLDRYELIISSREHNTLS